MLHHIVMSFYITIYIFHLQTKYLFVYLILWIAFILSAFFVNLSFYIKPRSRLGQNIKKKKMENIVQNSKLIKTLFLENGLAEAFNLFLSQNNSIQPNQNGSQNDNQNGSQIQKWQSRQKNSYLELGK